MPFSPKIQKFFRGKTILITGATGTVGEELARQLLPCDPGAIRIFSRDESRQFDMMHKFAEHRNLRYLVGDVRDRDRLDRAFEDVQVVFHLAALKHVGACEYNPFEAVKTNIQGTQNVVDSAILNEVEVVLFTSSDKAANPSNAMGASKLMAERLVIAANHYKGRRATRFACVRLGNVLGSRGSIIPLILEQLRNQQPVTLTDPNMTRFIMGLEPITSFVAQLAAGVQGGEIFVPRMPAVTTPDLLQAIINLYCRNTGGDARQVAMSVIGARPGEKNYEELVTEEESGRTWISDTEYLIGPQISDISQGIAIDGAQYRKLTDRGAISSERAPKLSIPEIEILIAPYIG